MKKLLTIFSLLLSLITLGQSNFPVEVTNQQSVIPREAYQGGYNNNAYSMLYVTRTALEAATNSSIGHLYALNAGFAPQPGKAAVIKSVSFTSTKTITIQGRVGIPVGPLNGVNVPERVFVATVDSGKVVTIPVNWVIRNGQQCTFYALNFIKSGDTAAWIGAFSEVYYITDDFNFNARKTMAVNDASSGMAPATSVANYQKLCTYFLNHPENKNIRVLVLGSTPLQNNTASSNAATLDAALLAMVNQFKLTPSYNGRIYFVPQSASFDRTVFSNYASTDVNGSGIHPNDTGSGLIFSVSWMNWFSTSDGQQFITWAKK